MIADRLKRSGVSMKMKDRVASALGEPIMIHQTKGHGVHDAREYVEYHVTLDVGNIDYELEFLYDKMVGHEERRQLLTLWKLKKGDSHGFYRPMNTMLTLHFGTVVHIFEIDRQSARALEEVLSMDDPLFSEALDEYELGLL